MAENNNATNHLCQYCVSSTSISSNDTEEINRELNHHNHNNNEVPLSSNMVPLNLSERNNSTLIVVDHKLAEAKRIASQIVDNSYNFIYPIHGAYTVTRERCEQGYDLKNLIVFRQYYAPELKAAPNAYGITLSCVHDIHVEPHKMCIVHTGIRVIVPVDSFGAIINHPAITDHTLSMMCGLIDRDFTSNIDILVLNNSDDSVRITRSTPIAQLIILHDVTDNVKAIPLYDTTVPYDNYMRRNMSTLSSLWTNYSNNCSI